MYRPVSMIVPPVCPLVQANAPWADAVGKAASALVCLLALNTGSAAAHDQVHRCTGSDGKTSFQSMPCPGSATSATVKPAARTQPASGSGAQRSGFSPAFTLPFDVPDAAAPGEIKPAARDNRPAPRAVKPASAATKALANGADVFVVSGYESGARTTVVNIDHQARPVVLVLTSYSRTQWKVISAPGTRLKAILVASHDEGAQESVDAPAQVPVMSDNLPYASALGNIKFRELMRKLNANYGVDKVLGYRGEYRLPATITLRGPFAADPRLTLDGIRPEAARVSLNFSLISADGRKLPFTSAGPKGGSRYAGITRGGIMSPQRAGPAVVADDGQETYFLDGWSALVWAPDGVNGRTEKLKPPANLPELSWASGLAWDTRTGILAMASFGGLGYLYRYDTRHRKWLDAHSLQNHDLIALTFNRTRGEYVGITDKAELVRINQRGELEDVQALDKLLPDLDSTYDKGNERLESLTVNADADLVVLSNVRNGTVTHIWTYDQRARKAQLTYKVID